jgi:hypothetical protein
MKNFIAIVLLALTSANIAQASNVKRYFNEAKFPNQALLNKQSILNPVAAGTIYVVGFNDGPTSAAAASLTSGLTSPDVPRNLRIAPTGTTADVAACVITVSGTNILGSTITETFTFLENASTEVVGSKAFKTVTSIAFPASCEDSPYGATWTVGIGEKLGLNRCLDSAGHLVFSTVSGAYESTRATVTADADEVEKNVADFNGTMDGSADFESFMVQNYRCAP